MYRSDHSVVMLEQPLIQIAGIIDREEAELVLACGVHYLGFPLRLPVHEEDLTESAAAEIIQSLKPPARGVVITYLDEADEIAGFSAELGAEIVQLHGDIPRTELEKLTTIAPELAVIKSLVIGLHDEAALSKMVHEQSPVVDAFITDTFDPQTGASGATGQTHDWEISRRLVELSSRPVILAGGLNPDNVRDAILTVRPAGVDVHTGVEEVSGRKSRDKLTRFMTEAQAAFREIGVF